MEEKMNYKIAIHKSGRKDFFDKKWIEFCDKNNIPYKVVNCYESDIIDQLKDCDALMWHFSQGNAKDFLFAKSLITSLRFAGKITFPDFSSGWHFDDKVAQKYLLESIQAPIVPSYVFYSKKNAIDWVKTTDFPKVFKLTGGAASSNVKLIKTKEAAVSIINKSFGKGHRQFDRISLFKDTFSKFKTGKSSFVGLLKSFLKIFVSSDYEKVRGKESGYIYFQEYLPNNEYDLRIVIIGEKAFALKRMVRPNDFRASGSGTIIYDKNQIDEECIKIAFEVSKKLKAGCLAYDFIYNKKHSPNIVEISYGFTPNAYFECDGYWDYKINWYPGNYCQTDWMVEEVIKKINNKKGYD